MEVGGINAKLNENTLETAKTKASDKDFEKLLKNAVDKNDDKELKKVCKEFEAVFLNMMYKQMKATVPKDGILKGDIGKDIFDSMLDEKLVEDASKGKGMGLSEMLYKQMKKRYHP